MVLYRTPIYQTSYELVGFSVQMKKFIIDFQDGEFLIRPILATFDLHVTSIFTMKFRVNWPLVQEKKY